MEPKKFQRTVEDFTCEKCGFFVEGTGYTNHCPTCLWGKHVDVNPGDRAASCGGLMEPVAVEKKGSDYVLTHRCATCGFKRANKVAANDDFDAIIALSKKM